MATDTKAYKFINDAQLVCDLVVNDEVAVRYVFYEHYTSLLRFNALKACHGKDVMVDDLIQELYLYLSANEWERLKKYDPLMPFVNWFSVVSYRFFKDFSRSMIDSSSVMPISNMNDHSIAMAGTGKISSIMMDIKRAISKLRPPRDKEILEALLIRDEEPERVAERFSVTVDNLYNIKRRALAKLIKNHLSDYQS